MKLTTILLLVSLLKINANSYSQNTKITLDLEKVSVLEVLNTIEAKTEFNFFFNKEDFNFSKIVTVKVKNGKIKDILNKLFHNSNLYHGVVDRQIVLYPNEDSVENKDAVLEEKVQELEISGTVTDAQGVPLPGVNIIIENTYTGVDTNFDGEYNITAKKGDVLVYSYIGMLTQKITVGDESTIHVKLIEDAAKLDEVVVTALGIKREKKALAYAVTTVDGDQFTEARETNIANGLQGKVAGVNVSNIASGPGGSSRVIIRGNSSIQGNNQPLYVIDGIPIDNQNLGSAGQWGGSDQGDGIGNINPDDIETMTVLKGNTAGALYGYRAANGVILITTKRGAKGANGLQLEVNSNFVFDKAINRLDTQTEYGHGDNGVKPATLDAALTGGDRAWGGKLDGSMAYQFDGVQRPYAYTGDNFDRFYETGTTFTNTVAVSGGTDKMGFRFSASDLENTGIIPNNGLNRNNFTMNAHGKIGDKLSFSTSGSYIVQDTKNPPQQGDLVSNVNYTVWSLAPSFNVLDLIGNHPTKWGAREDGTELTPGKTVWFENPYFSAYEKKEVLERNRFLGNMSFQYDFNDWVFLKGRIGIDQWDRSRVKTRPFGGAQSPKGYIQQFQQKFRETNSDILIGTQHEFENGFAYNAIFGGSQMRQEIYRNETNGYDFAVSDWVDYNNALTRNGSVISSESGVNSLYGQAEFSYNSYLFLTVTGREDWFSTLNGRGIFYPSVGVSGLISEMIELPSSINYLKTRVSWAQVGGGIGSAYSLNQSYGLGQPINGVAQGTIQQGYVANSGLVPYTVTEKEFGIEARLLNGRLGVDLTYYDRTTTDDILDATISNTSGYNSAKVNVGELTNKGIELLLTGTPIKNENFSWNVSLNISNNKSKIVSLIDGVDRLQLQESRAQTANISHITGMEYGQVTGWQYLRDNAGELVLNAAGYPQRDTDAGLVPFGTGVHPFTSGLQNTFNHKNFSLSFLIDYKAGAVIFSGTNSWLYRRGMHKNTLVGRENGIGIVPASGIAGYYNEIRNKIAEEFVYDADFAKLRELSIGYKIPKSLLSKLGISSAKFSIVGRNLLLLHSSVENIDPESTFSEGNAQGLDYFQTPQSRSYGFNLNLKF